MLLAALLLTPPALAQAVDPGPRGGPAGAGGPIPGISTDAEHFFQAASVRFREIDSVFGSVVGEPGTGLGPGFNLNGCAGCHAYPSVGGSSPPTNPEVAMATLDGAHNTVPAFVTPQGPVREARFILNSDGTPDGTIHNLFTIAGRIDAPACSAPQPDFAGAAAAHNLTFRIPLQLFGLGLVESVSDSALEAAKAAADGKRFGITGHFNHSPDDGTIMRFGWKADIKSLMVFAGAAYNLEQGVTNEIYPNKRNGGIPACLANQLPEDQTRLRLTRHSVSPASDYSSDVVNFAGFTRLLAPASPAAATRVTERGREIFVRIGCAACHIPALTTGLTTQPATTNLTFFPYSDFALHAMGAQLADQISQGEATGDDFRTTPLWGIGQRLFFLHDGRTTDLVTAIDDHASPGSEANAVLARWQALNTGQQQAVLDFLRGL